ncbi:hypothetical protein MUP77_12275 [Candidatus Bathyarchaeota archaeon]|nr:hypothetical protein [Candidatus Bathyarchaeota archaeon]
MEETKSIDALNEILSEAQQEFAELGSSDLLGSNESQRQLYFAHYSLLKRLISSIESFLNEDRKLRKLESQVQKARTRV